MIPTTLQLDERKKQAEAKMRDLQIAYQRFLHEWEETEKEEAHLLKNIHRYVDDVKLQVISKKISNIKNT